MVQMMAGDPSGQREHIRRFKTEAEARRWIHPKKRR
jgi:hypothetical protein